MKKKASSLDKWLAVIDRRWKKVAKFKVPEEKLKHLAIICDGNRRAAREKGLNPYFGHRAGIDVIRGISRACRQWGVRTLTFWTWSTENWKREDKQVRYIMNLAAKFLVDSELRREIIEDKVHFRWLGRRDRLSSKIKRALESLEDETEDFSALHLNLAMDYGGQDEMGRAIVKIGRLIRSGKMVSKDILANPALILDYLDTASQHLPDLVIRTGVHRGELPHTSGFMPLQSAYAAWQFIPNLFPDLTPTALLASVKQFLLYQRRFGK